MSIAVAAAAVSIAATTTTTTMSFVQAAKQKQLQREAEDDAARAMAEARKKLDVNFYDQLAIQKEPYMIERDALIAAGAQAIQAGVESERGAGAVAGRVQLAQQEGQRKVAAAMGQEMLGLERLSAQEDARLRDVGIQLDLEEVSGAQLAAASASQNANAALAQGMQGVTSLGNQIIQQAPLIERTASAKDFSKIEANYNKQIADNTLSAQYRVGGVADGKPLSLQQAMAIKMNDPSWSKLNVNQLADEYTKNNRKTFTPDYWNQLNPIPAQVNTVTNKVPVGTGVSNEYWQTLSPSKYWQQPVVPLYDNNNYSSVELGPSPNYWK